MPVFNDIEETIRPAGREALLRVGLDALGEGIALYGGGRRRFQQVNLRTVSTRLLVWQQLER